MARKDEKFLIAIDGGGTKTTGVLVNLKGKIFKKVKLGPSNPQKVGFERAVSLLKKLIFELSKKKRIELVLIGLAGGLERDPITRKRIEKKLAQSFCFPIIVEGDQKIGFLAGTDEKDGVLIIAGTGSIAMGWRGKKEAISGGWDWLLGDQGSGFWIGKKALETILSILDGRSKEKTILKEKILEKFKIKEEREFYRKFYEKDFVEKIASVSKLVDECAEKGDKLSIKILKESAKELSKMAISVIKQLKLEKERFPLVLVGSVFKSKIITSEFQKEIKKVAKNAKFVFPKKEPVFGAIKLAIEKYACLRN